jgi:hypothetical protein
VDKQQQDKQQQQQESFTIISTDESFFFYDSLVRRVWMDGNNRPIVRVTGSHKHSCIFGAISIEGNHQLFRQYDRFNGDTFLDYLKKLHAKFPKCYLFMDKASPHYKSKKIRQYFEENKDTHPYLSSNCITRVYGYGRDMEHSQKRSTCSTILSIICRF